MDIYDWIFCYKDGTYFLYKIKDRNFPFKVEDDKIVIDRSLLQKKMIELANRILEKWDMNAILGIYENHLKKQKVELPKELERIIEEGEVPKKYPFLSYWYTVKRLFDEATKRRLPKIIQQIYDFFRKPIFPYEENVEMALEILFKSKECTLKQKIALGFALVFCLYRINLLRKGGRVILK